MRRYRYVKQLQESNITQQQHRSLLCSCLQVLVTEGDFHEVMVSYLSSVAAQNVRHSEIFFDPQVHTMRGVGFEVFMPGFIAAMHECQQQLGTTAKLLMCFMTELGPQEAAKTLQQVRLPGIPDCNTLQVMLR